MLENTRKTQFFFKVQKKADTLLGHETMKSRVTSCFEVWALVYSGQNQTNWKRRAGFALYRSLEQDAISLPPIRWELKPPLGACCVRRRGSDSPLSLASKVCRPWSPQSVCSSPPIHAWSRLGRWICFSRQEWGRRAPCSGAWRLFRVQISSKSWDGKFANLGCDTMRRCRLVATSGQTGACQVKKSLTCCDKRCGFSSRAPAAVVWPTSVTWRLIAVGVRLPEKHSGWGGCSVRGLREPRHAPPDTQLWSNTKSATCVAGAVEWLGVLTMWHGNVPCRLL